MFQTTCPTEVLDFTVDGKCSNCGACCSNLLPLSRDEIKTIRQYVKKHHIKKAASGIPFNANISMICPFMDASKEHKCRIYHIRPKICRFFYCNKKPSADEAMQMVDMEIVNMEKTFFE